MRHRGSDHTCQAAGENEKKKKEAQACGELCSLHVLRLYTAEGSVSEHCTARLKIATIVAGALEFGIFVAVLNLY